MDKETSIYDLARYFLQIQQSMMGTYANIKNINLVPKASKDEGLSALQASMMDAKMTWDRITGLRFNSLSLLDSQTRLFEIAGQLEMIDADTRDSMQQALQDLSRRVIGLKQDSDQLVTEFAPR